MFLSQGMPRIASGPPEAGKKQRNLLPKRLGREAVPANTLISDFYAPRTVKEHISVF